MNHRINAAVAGAVVGLGAVSRASAQFIDTASAGNGGVATASANGGTAIADASGGDYNLAFVS
jgi:hypothetical protein